MGKVKTSRKPRQSSKNSFPHPVKLKPGVKTYPHDPAASLRKTDEVLQALAECVVTADFSAFKEIIFGYFEARNVSQELAKAKIPRRTFYNAMKANSNPSWDVMTKLIKIISKNSDGPQKRTTTRRSAW